jgi:predicted Zn-dependent protease
VNRIPRDPDRLHPTATRIATAAALALVSALVLLPLAGCGAGRQAQRSARGTAAAPAATPRATSPLAEAREQAALAPDEPYWPYRIAELQLEADSLAAAEHSLEAALARDPGFAPALALLSKLWFESGRHEQAVRTLEEARARAAGADGLPPALELGLALHYDALDRPDLAERVLERLGPDGRRAGASAAAYLLLRGEHPEEAADPAAAALRSRPKSAVSLNNHGIVMLRAGEVEAARRAFAAAVERDAALPGPYYNLAILERYYAFDEDAALRWFRLYRERSSEDPDGLAGVFGEGPAAARTESGGGR